MKRWPVLLALVEAIALSRPAWAVSMFGRVYYDEPHRTLMVETSGMPLVQTKRLINPDRLVVDVMDAMLPSFQTQMSTVRSRRIRNYLAMQVSQSPNVVRIVIELQSGIEPMVKVRQVPGSLALTIDDPPAPTGERDLETLPQVDPLPSAAPVLVGTTETPAPLPGPTAAPLPIETPIPLPTATPAHTPPPPPAPVSVVPPSRKPQGFGSTLLLRWQQGEALDDYGAPTGAVFAYPTGFNGLELRNWNIPWLGFGLDSRFLNYDEAAEGARTNRTDLMVLPELVVRYPFWDGRIEPEASLGYLGRQVNVYANQTGKTFPFSPTQFYDGLAFGLGGRVRLLPPVSLAVSYQYLPAVGGGLFRGLGIDYGTVFPLTETRWSAALQFDLGPSYTEIGYSEDSSKNRSIGFAQSFTGIFAGLGWRY